MEEVELVEGPGHGRVRGERGELSLFRPVVPLRYGLDYVAVLIRSYREARS